jgi:hypothetical protein
VSTKIQTITRTVFATVALSVAALSLPAFAESFDDEALIKKQEYHCQSIEKAARALKKKHYKHVEYQGDEKECVYIFSADKKRDGEYWSWIVYYDAYDREIIGREPQKKEEKVEM